MIALIPQAFGAFYPLLVTHPSLCPSIDPSAHPSIHLSVFLFARPSVCRSNHPSAHLSVHSSICLFTLSSVCSSVSPPICRSIHLSIRLPDCLSIHPFTRGIQANAWYHHTSLHQLQTAVAMADRVLSQVSLNVNACIWITVPMSKSITPPPPQILTLVILICVM